MHSFCRLQQSCVTSFNCCQSWIRCSCLCRWFVLNSDRFKHITKNEKVKLKLLIKNVALGYGVSKVVSPYGVAHAAPAVYGGYGGYGGYHGYGHGYGHGLGNFTFILASNAAIIVLILKHSLLFCQDMLQKL